MSRPDRQAPPSYHARPPASAPSPIADRPPGFLAVLSAVARDVAALVASGRMTRADVHRGQAGARRYRAALQSGRVVSLPVARARYAVCAACPAATPGVAGGTPALWCGRPLAAEPAPDGGPTCGCYLPAKVWTADESCPRRAWAADSVTQSTPAPKSSAPPG